MTETWAYIKGYEGKYMVSNTGLVKALNFMNTGKERIMRQSLNGKGYHQLCLTLNNKKRTWRVHRLVAEAFVPNPNGYPTVNHIDENKDNNSAQNLEWCTFTYNSKYGTRAERCGKPVIQLDLDGNRLQRFPSVAEAARVSGADRRHIGTCAGGNPRRKTVGGYKWVYE